MAVLGSTGSIGRQSARRPGRAARPLPGGGPRRPSRCRHARRPGRAVPTARRRRWRRSAARLHLPPGIASRRGPRPPARAGDARGRRPRHRRHRRPRQPAGHAGRARRGQDRGDGEQGDAGGRAATWSCRSRGARGRGGHRPRPGPPVAGAARSAWLRPIDSEHSAIWQCLAGEHLADVARLILTASGGPFRDGPARPRDALRRPRRWPTPPGTWAPRSRSTRPR